jgi:hypothetical protein
MATELEKLAYCGTAPRYSHGKSPADHLPEFDKHCHRCSERLENMAAGRALGHEEAAKVAKDAAESWDKNIYTAKTSSYRGVCSSIEDALLSCEVAIRALSKEG